MIVLDIEASGVDFGKCGILQIGAIDLDNPKNFFLEECRLDEEDLILNPLFGKPVLEILGKTEKELRDKRKQSPKEMLINFFKWASKIKINNLICQNPQFDLAFIQTKARKYNLDIPFHYKALDLHSIAQFKYFEINNCFFEDKLKNRLGLGLTEILKFCGIEDERNVHNALEDAKLTAECFFRLIHGKNLFSCFEKFKIPDYLR
ncbi:MAG: 3'-5' exonuclease [Nanoarchaeota archaeon]